MQFHRVVNAYLLADTTLVTACIDTGNVIRIVTLKCEYCHMKYTYSLCALRVRISNAFSHFVFLKK